MKKRMLTIFMLLIFNQAIHAGWLKVYGGSKNDLAREVIQTSDGGYAVVGATESFGSRMASMWLLKTDPAGDTVWTRTYGRYEGSLVNAGTCIEETPEGGFIVTGTTMNLTPTLNVQSNLWLISIDPSGNPVWERTLGGDGFATGEYVTCTPDGGFLAIGSYKSPDEKIFNILVFKTDAEGTTQWWKTYRSRKQKPSFGYCAKPTMDGNYLLCGVMDEDLCLIKIDTSGQIAWIYLYGGDNLDAGLYFRETADSGYIVVGHTDSFGAGDNDVWLIKTNKDGDTLWTRTYGGPGDEIGRAVCATPDGGYLFTGSTESYGRGEKDLWLVRTRANGDTVWTRTYGGKNKDEGFDVGLTAEGNYIMTGYTWDESEDVWLIQTNALGDTL